MLPWLLSLSLEHHSNWRGKRFIPCARGQPYSFSKRRCNLCTYYTYVRTEIPFSLHQVPQHPPVQGTWSSFSSFRKRGTLDSSLLKYLKLGLQVFIYSTSSPPISWGDLPSFYTVAFLLINPCYVLFNHYSLGLALQVIYVLVFVTRLVFYLKVRTILTKPQRWLRWVLLQCCWNVSKYKTRYNFLIFILSYNS